MKNRLEGGKAKSILTPEHTIHAVALSHTSGILLLVVVGLEFDLLGKIYCDPYCTTRDW